METIKKNSKTPLLKKLGFTGIGLCALMCSLPIVGATLGMGALTAAAAYFEKIGAGILILSVGFPGYWLIKKRSAEAVAPSCDVDCGCKREIKRTGQAKL